MDDLSRIVAVDEICRLKYRYLRCLDQKLWDDIAGCFTADAVAEYSAGSYRFEGRDAIVDFLRRSMGSEQFLSSHRCHHPEIDVIGPTTAVGVWALEDTVVHGEHNITIQGAAFYEDEYVRDDDGWRIARTGYRRTYEEIFPRSSVEGLRLTASWWSTGGRSDLDASS
ncbi:MAG: nuclear transport factor 2 family protein [Actinomycetes bacterium]